MHVLAWQKGAIHIQQQAGDATIEQMLEDPQLRHNESFFESEDAETGRRREVRPPARFSKTALTPGGLAPGLGEHTEAVLAELGYDAEQIASLRSDGVIP